MSASRDELIHLIEDMPDDQVDALLADARRLPCQPSQRRWIGREELLRRLQGSRADSGLGEDLAKLVGETTDDLGPIR